MKRLFSPSLPSPIPPCVLTLLSVLKNHKVKNAVNPIAMAMGLLLLPICWNRYLYSLICTGSRGT